MSVHPRPYAPRCRGTAAPPSRRPSVTPVAPVARVPTVTRLLAPPVLLILLLTAVGLGTAAPVFPQEAGLPQGDPQAGAFAYRQCATCHSFSPTDRKLGPHLDAIIGRPAASVEGYRYSQALRDADLVWTRDTLAAYITDPRSLVPGGTMLLPVRDPSQVPDIIAYLKQQGGRYSPEK